MFNLTGSEIIVILLLALVILGPEKLPEAMRKAGRAYSELRKMANSFQSEVRSVMEEPMGELRGTADALREAADFTGSDKKGPKKAGEGERAKPQSAPAPDEGGASAGAPEQQHSPPEVDEHADNVDSRVEGEDVVTRTLSGDVDPPPGEAPTT